MTNQEIQNDFNFTDPQPLVSVVVPVYNNQDTITNTLDSIFSQDYKNIEVILVNDGSTDDTSAILERYKDIAKIINQTNSGSAVARTQGIKNATGKYIAFIDADDLWVPWKISTQVRYLEQHQDIGMVFNSWIELHSESNELPKTPPPPEFCDAIEEENSGWIYTRLLMECIVHTSSVVILKSICDQVGDFDTTLRRGQDYDYWIRVSQLTKINKLKSVLSAYRIHSSSITNTAPVKNYEAILLTNAIQKFGYSDKDGGKISKNIISGRMANSWKNFCWQAYHAGQHWKSAYSGIQMIKYRPLWHLGWAYLFLSLAKIIFQMLIKAKPTLPPHPAG